MSAALDIRLLSEEEDLVIWFHEGTSDRLVVAFSAIDGKNVAVPGPVFARSASDNGRHHVLFVSDPKRTWLNGEGLIDRIASIIMEAKAASGAREVCAVGMSMGGFAALHMAGIVPIQTVLAMSPQFSVHPEIVGDDRRWWYFRKYIKTHRVRTALDQIAPETAYHVIHGGDASEATQRDRFPDAANINNLVLPGMGHLFPERLKKMKLLHGAVVAGLNDDTAGLMEALAPVGIKPRQGVVVE